MPRVSTCKLALALVLLVSLGTNRSEAGPTKYDPKTKSFPINYTFAALPSFGMPPEQIAQLGEIQKATDEQETQIRTIYQSVSKILEDVTSGRAKIGSFNYVDNVKQADVIISLTGKFDRAAWAVSGGVDGKPGQVGLYYLYLEDRSSQEIANTVGHELCHYLFALPDEYASTAVAECPLQNPESPGCWITISPGTASVVFAAKPITIPMGHSIIHQPLFKGTRLKILANTGSTSSSRTTPPTPTRPPRLIPPRGRREFSLARGRSTNWSIPRH